MARRRSAEHREITADPKYKSTVISQFVNYLMRMGKKSTAEHICYKCIDKLGEKAAGDGLSLFKKAINNVKPILEVKSRRVGGATYQVPVEVSQERRTALAMRWIITYAKSRKGKSMVEKLTEEMLQASNNEGSAIKKREDTHKMAEANKAFAHFRW